MKNEVPHQQEQREHTDTKGDNEASLKRMRGPLKTPLRENVEAIVVALILALIVRTFVFQAFKIPSGSMRNTLLEGDHILVNKFIYTDPMPLVGISLFPVQKPERRDIIVFKFPKEPQRDFIKRCIAKGGDSLKIRDTQLWVNGELQDEQSFVNYSRGMQRDSSISYLMQFNHYGPTTIPDSSYFMMGDNRDNSQDSRFWGFLDEGLIKGKAFMIYLSVEDGSQPLWKRIRWKRFFQKIR